MKRHEKIIEQEGLQQRQQQLRRLFIELSHFSLLYRLHFPPRSSLAINFGAGFYFTLMAL